VSDGINQSLPLIDGHIHLPGREMCDKLLADLKYTGTRKFAVQNIGRSRHDPDGKGFRQALEMKQRMPEEVFVFGGLDFSDITDGAYKPRVPLVEQVQKLRDMGCDGLKLLTGKPDFRKFVGHPLDGALFEPMLKWAEETRFPVLWHVGDPPEFWSEHTVPPWARTRGWWYDSTVPKKKQIDEEIERVFLRHPKLNVTLPHFFFLSDRLDDAAKLLDTYPNYALDLAPGVEMYHNFTANHAKARAFFIKYADRILYGSDFGMGCGWGQDRGMMIRRFLETDDRFDVPEDPAMTPDERPKLHGLNLPADAVRKICVDNFVRRVGAKPRSLAADVDTLMKRWMV